MKIREIRCAGLRGATPAGGWNNELKPDDCVHTLVAVHTDEGLIGLGERSPMRDSSKLPLRFSSRYTGERTHSSQNAFPRNYTKTPFGWAAGGP